MHPEQERFKNRLILLKEITNNKRHLIAESKNKIINQLLIKINKTKKLQQKWDHLSTIEYLLMDSYNEKELQAVVFDLKCALEYYNYKDKNIIDKELLNINFDNPINIEKNREILKQIKKKMNIHIQTNFYKPIIASFNINRVGIFVLCILALFVTLVIFTEKNIFNFFKVLLWLFLLIFAKYCLVKFLNYKVNKKIELA